jgi:hypothetical protein
MSKKKRFFAQTPPGKGHQARHFHTLDEARVWVAQNGGGSIKMRNAGSIHSVGHGFERVIFNPPLKVWRTIETWPSVVKEKNIAAISPLRQTFRDIHADTALSGHDLGDFELVDGKGPCLFRAHCQICNRFVEVTQKGVVYSLLGDGRCRRHE